LQTTSNPSSTITAKRIYPAERSTSAWKIDDASAGGAPTDGSGDVAFADAKIFTTGNWSTSYSTSRYVDFDYNAPLAAGLPVTGAEVQLPRARQRGRRDRLLLPRGPEALDERRPGDLRIQRVARRLRDGNGVRGRCRRRSRFLANTDLGNDLRIRVYATNSASHPAKVDMATVTGAIYGVPFTLYRASITDASTGTAAAPASWALNATDGTAYASAGNWTSAFSGTRYLRSTSRRTCRCRRRSPLSRSITRTSRTPRATRRAGTPRSTTSTTLIGTHGSTGTPVSCNATTNYQADTVSLPEVDTTTEANSLVVKVFMSVSGNRKSLTDLFRVRMTYSLGPTGCVDSGVHTYQAVGDSWIQQDNATSNNGTDTLLDVKANATKNRRALVNFSLPTLPTDCSLTAATLRMYLSTTGGARTMNAYQASSSWTETGVTWNNQPTTTGSAASAATGSAGSWTAWTVTSIVQAQLAGTNYGFLIQDSNEASGNIAQSYMSRENTNVPELQLTFG
jgi:hypothetical protein